MDTTLLKQFHDQEHMRNEVFKFLKTSLDKQALAMVIKGIDTTNLNVAYKALASAEQELVNEFSIKRAGTIKNNAI